MSLRLLTGLALSAALAAPGVAHAARKEPALKASTAKLRAALTCPSSLAGAKQDPVLLIHGTFADSQINWSFNYAKQLPAVGHPVCWVDLPGKAAGDIQVSTEYVVFAIRQMAKQSGRHVALLSHSQGGLEARWALRWWPSLRRLVSDAVLLVAPNYGALYPDGNCTHPMQCAAALYQMRSDSKFLKALNRGGDAAGRVPITSIATTADQLFVRASQAALKSHSHSVRSVTVQSLCPSDQPQHNDMPFDGPAYALVIDALTHPGPADPRRVDSSACAQSTMPGVDHDDAEARLQAYSGTLIKLLGPDGPKAKGEPKLAAYARRS
jgi:pimeloyl-ACP methyl ester carboxylesterase